MRKTRISNLFVGSGRFCRAQKNEFGALVVDEAHRLLLRSQYEKTGENQVKEIINASTFSVFFLDEDQQVHWQDIGSRDEILHWAGHLNVEITELTLASQFRCNGSDGYLAWADHALQIRETANTTLEGANYQFTVCDSASELRERIYAANRISNRARMVAGYCWDWNSRSTKARPIPAEYDFDLEEGSFRAKWNLTDDGYLWIMKPNSVQEVGCIHTCQGLELDYIGVIVGPDLIVRDGVVHTDGTKRSKHDRSMFGYKKLLKVDPDAAKAKADRIIKNTYRTLMTRGLKGCFLYSTDPETNEYFKTASTGAVESLLEAELETQEKIAPPFVLLTAEEATTETNTVPVFDIKVAAGNFSQEQWLDECNFARLPEHFSAKDDYFVAQVLGESMNRRIPSGSWCLFRQPSPGSRDGKVVLVQARDIQDPDTGGQYTVKRYRSKKTTTEESWTHSQIRLEPDSNDPSYQPIHLESDLEAAFTVIGEFVAVIH